LKQNVLAAAKPLWFLSSLQKANRFTAENASQSTILGHRRPLVATPILNPNKLGLDGEITGMQEKRKSTLVFSASSRTHPNEKEHRMLMCLAFAFRGCYVRSYP
jgi:hypothetical protein